MDENTLLPVTIMPTLHFERGVVSGLFTNSSIMGIYIENTI
jgi:hypothetical protein